MSVTHGKEHVMRRFGYFGGAVLALGLLAGGTAHAEKNMCQAGNLTCPTTMPVGGFCECTSHGDTKDGTVVKKPAPNRHVNASAGGCGAQPGAPGCK
jgi:hypothetical protein